VCVCVCVCARMCVCGGGGGRGRIGGSVDPHSYPVGRLHMRGTRRFFVLRPRADPSVRCLGTPRGREYTRVCVCVSLEQVYVNNSVKDMGARLLHIPRYGPSAVRAVSIGTRAEPVSPNAVRPAGASLRARVFPTTPPPTHAPAATFGGPRSTRRTPPTRTGIGGRVSTHDGSSSRPFAAAQ
jgi:hypothetical protein